MTLTRHDLYTTFCFTWGWPWRNAALRIYVCYYYYSPTRFFFFFLSVNPPSFSHLSFLSLPVLLFSLSLSVSVTQQRVVSVNQAGPFSLAGPWLVLMMFPKRWRGQLRGHRSCSPLFTACRFMFPSLFFPLFLRHSRSLSYHIFSIINIDRAVHLEPLFNNWLPRLIWALMVSACG